MGGSKKAAYHHGDLAAALVHEAREVIGRASTEAVSLRKIASAVGVSANATYRHFPDKSALLAEVARQAFEELAQLMSDADLEPSSAGSIDPVERFKTIGRIYVRYARDNPELFRLMFGPHGYRCLSGDDGPGEEMPFTNLSTALDALVDAGALPASARAGAEIPAWTTIHGFTALALEGALGEAGDDPATLEGLLEFVARGLVAG